MNTFINDALDVCRFRLNPLVQYQYPTWQLFVILLGLGLTSAATAEGFVGDVGARVVFFTALNALEIIMLAQFMRWWLRLSGWKEDAPLLPFILLTHLPQMLEPLSTWFPEPLDQVVGLSFAIYALMVMIHGLAKYSGLTRFRVVMGMVLFTPLALLILSLMLGLAVQLGWIDPSLLPSATEGNTP